MLGDRLSNRDVELLLCGKLPENEALTPLAPMLSAFHDFTWPAPADDAVARFASAAATIARSPAVAHLKSAPPVRSRFLVPTYRRLATGLASLLLVSGLAGVAAASNDAAPGDVLYGIDRALESIGVGAGGATERVSEVWVLFERGQIAEAVGHAIRTANIDGEQPTALMTDESAASADAIRSAADDIGAANDESGSNERAAVAALLNEIAAMLEDPALGAKGLGQSVAEIARLLGGDSVPSGPGQPGIEQSEPDKPGAAKSDQASAPPFDSSPGPDDDPAAAPSDPPGKSPEAPGKTDTSPDTSQDTSPGKSGGNPASPPSRP